MPLALRILGGVLIAVCVLLVALARQEDDAAARFERSGAESAEKLKRFAPDAPRTPEKVSLEQSASSDPEVAKRFRTTARQYLIVGIAAGVFGIGLIAWTFVRRRPAGTASPNPPPA